MRRRLRARLKVGARCRVRNQLRHGQSRDSAKLRECAERNRKIAEGECGPEIARGGTHGQSGKCSGESGAERKARSGGGGMAYLTWNCGNAINGQGIGADETCG